MTLKSREGRDLRETEDAASFNFKELVAEALKRWHRRLHYLSIFTAVPAILLSDAGDVWADTSNSRELTRKTTELGTRSIHCKPELLRRKTNYFLPHQKRTFDVVSAFAGNDNCPGTPIPAGTYTQANPWVDSGTTAGANDTVGTANCFYSYYSYFTNPGRDVAYSFMITARGPDPQIRVTPAENFDAMVYILHGSLGHRCPFGEHVVTNNCLTGQYPAQPSGVATLAAFELNELPLNTPLHLFVDSYWDQNTFDSSFAYTLRLQDLTIAPANPIPNDVPVDVNGDAKTDLTIVRNIGGGPSGQLAWFTRTSAQEIVPEVLWGTASDRPVPADFDGDGKDDIAVFRPGPQGRFYIVESRTQTARTIDFGQTGDDPSVVADYNGDNIDDVAVYRPGSGQGGQSFWYVQYRGDSYFQTVAWGQSGDTPAPGDYDGDNRSDFVVRRAHENGVDGRFYQRFANNVIEIRDFGKALDRIVPADYNGDGMTDLAVVRPGNDGILVWEYGIVRDSAILTFNGFWGQAEFDIPAPGDYDGDGQADFATWRLGANGFFYIRRSSDLRMVIEAWGQSGDYPVAAFNVH